MAMLPLGVILTALFLEDDDLLAARLAENRCHDRGTLDGGTAGLRRIAADHQHVVERDFALLGSAENVTLDLDAISNGHAVLLPTGTNDGVHTTSNKLEQRDLARPALRSQPCGQCKTL